MRRPLILLLILLALTAPLAGAASTPPPAAEADPVDSLLDSLTPQTGVIELPNGIAKLNVSDNFRYIGPEDTKRFLEDGWGNDDASGTQGMLLPIDTDLFSNEGWGVVITYQEDGHVSDADANDIDYTDLLKSMQESATEASAERKKQGLGAVELIGWAAPPRYDAGAKKLYWAKELKFGDDAENTLNYNVRILGRKGVLVMNAVSNMSQLPRIEQGMTEVLSFAEFKEGQRYSDFDSGVDEVATYGIAALIGGGIAAKAGLFAKLGIALLALKKFIVIGLVAAGGFIVKLFRRKKESTPPALATLEEPPSAPEA